MLPFTGPIMESDLLFFPQEVIDDPELDAVWDSFFPSTVPVVPEAGSLPGCSARGVIYTPLRFTVSPTIMVQWEKLAPNERKLLGGNHFSLP